MSSVRDDLEPFAEAMSASLICRVACGAQVDFLHVWSKIIEVGVEGEREADLRIKAEQLLHSPSERDYGKGSVAIGGPV